MRRIINALEQSACRGRTLPPAVFDQALFLQLLNLSGEQGARALLRDAVAIEADPSTLSDLDRLADLPAHSCIHQDQA